MLLLAALLPDGWLLAEPSLGDGAWLDVSDTTWFIPRWWSRWCTRVPSRFLWRGQLCHAWLTWAFGDAGFVVRGVIFFPFLLARPVLSFAVGAVDAVSLTDARAGIVSA